MKSTHNGISYTSIDDRKSQCERCSKIINNVLLVAHSLVHKHETNKYSYSQKSPPIPNSSSTLRLHEPLTKDPQLFESSKISLRSPYPEENQQSTKAEKVSLTTSLQIRKKAISRLDRINNTHSRSVKIQQHKGFRKWLKFLRSGD